MKTKGIKEQDYLERELALIEQALEDCELSDTTRIKELSARKQSLLTRLNKYTPLFY